MVAPTMPTMSATAAPTAASEEARAPPGAVTLRAPGTGQALTHSLQEMHSELVTTSAVATSMFIMQALSQRPQSMQAPASRRMFRKLTLDRSPSRAPAGQRYLQKKRSYTSEPAREMTRTARPMP